MLACPTHIVHANNTLCLEPVYVRVFHGLVQNSPGMDPLPSPRQGELDVEKWFVCADVSSVFVCGNNILVYRMQFPLNMPILM